jgi:hypothetical protein
MNDIPVTVITLRQNTKSYSSTEEKRIKRPGQFGEIQSARKKSFTYRLHL